VSCARPRAALTPRVNLHGGSPWTVAVRTRPVTVPEFRAVLLLVTRRCS
jgi:hypothetical protein